jgi:hypothetical protein
MHLVFEKICERTSFVIFQHSDLTIRGNPTIRITGCDKNIDILSDDELLKQKELRK